VLKIATGKILPDGGEVRGGVVEFPNLEAFCAALNKGSAPSTGKQRSGPYWSPFETPRAKGEAPDWTCLVLDFDQGIDMDTWNKMGGFERVVYDTPSSTEGVSRYRVIIAVDEPIEFKAVDQLRRLFPGADHAAVKPTQIFWHRHPKFEAKYYGGARMNWRAVIADLPQPDYAGDVAQAVDKAVLDSVKPTMSRQALTEALYALDPDSGYEDWLRAGMALHHEYAGSEDGFAEWLAWSERGAKFAGVNDLRSHWKSFKPGGGITGLSLLAMQSAKIDDFPIIEDAPVPQLAIGDAQIQPVELPPYLVDGLIEQNAEVLIYGAQGTFKSLFAIEIGVCVATGKPFFGRAAMQGLTVYLAGEGAGGVRRRVRALKLARSLESIGAFVIYDGKRVRFENEDSRKLLRAIIEELEKRTGCKLRLLVIDTYSRYAPGFDAKRPADEQMYKWLENVASVRGEATVLVVHHTGHDGGHARGTSAWNQATDTVFRTEGKGDDPRTFINEKQKDGQLATPMHFQKMSVDSGYTRRRLDDTVEPVFSVALDPTVIEVEDKLTPNEQLVWDSLVVPANLDDLKSLVAPQLPKPEGRDRRREFVAKAIKNMLDKGAIFEQDGMLVRAAQPIADFDVLMGNLEENVHE
jgi:hypothetical protein